MRAMALPTLEQLIEAGSTSFPGLVGLEIDRVGDGVVSAHLDLRPAHLAPNGYLHAGALVTLADTACGYGCVLSLPPGAAGFTTIELKVNFRAIARRYAAHWFRGKLSTGRRGSCATSATHPGAITPRHGPRAMSTPAARA